MKAWIDEDGYLQIQGGKSIEVYALKVWCEQSPQVGELPDNLIVHLILPEVRRGEDAELEKAKCCGSCKWYFWRLINHSDYSDHCRCKESEYYREPMWPNKLCNKWEVRE